MCASSWAAFCISLNPLNSTNVYFNALQTPPIFANPIGALLVAWLFLVIGPVALLHKSKLVDRKLLKIKTQKVQ